MSQVVVSPPAIPALATQMMLGVQTTEPRRSQLHLNTAGDREVCLVSVEEKILASQLAYLASQHHTSEYNRLKFGSAGAPVAYIPLSIQLPAQVQEMKAKQVQYAHKRAWWFAEPSVKTDNQVVSIRRCRRDCNLEPIQRNVIPSGQASTELDPADRPATLGKPMPPLNYPHASNLRRELSVAMSSPLSIITIPQLSSQNTCHQSSLDIYAKTSESHPINISPIVPLDILPLLSSHLVPTPPRTPYMFDLPPSLLLDHHASCIPSNTIQSHPMVRPPKVAHLDHAGQPHPALEPVALTRFFTRISGSSTINSGHDRNSKVSFNTLGNASEVEVQTPLDLSRSPFFPLDPTVLEDSSLPSSSIPYRPRSAPPSATPAFVPRSELYFNKVVIPPQLPELMHAMSSDILDYEVVGFSHKESPSTRCGVDISPTLEWAHHFSSSIPSSLTSLGNMLLSSCPGKKVRLSGPVKGRGAICRDLGRDLKRVKELGVGCVICCLDDEELDFLGASWPQYSEIALKVGLDVLRIPIPEGLAPSTPAQLDEHLTYIIRSYTLKGVPVLVHCRGGVGRAGLVACCWMLKLGLCGWLEPPVIEMSSHTHQWPSNNAVKVRKETVQLVERVITIVRRRRSVKAIETYEQVRFLVEFVEHLQSSGGIP